MPSASPAPSNSLKLFRVLGIDVYLHYTWFFVAVLELSLRTDKYASPVWNVLEYLTLFTFVLLHEFGHALACRSTGGSADLITLWPLGGVAYVSPPSRPGAWLWSIAAGPLVNVALAVPTVAAAVLGQSGLLPLGEDAKLYLVVIAVINIGLFVFNVLPFWPLDGGKILYSTLWFFLGRGRSMQVATGVGLVGAAALAICGAVRMDVWLGIMAVFMGSQAWRAWKAAPAMAAFDALPIREGVACAACGKPVPRGRLWRCSCGAETDPFEGACPSCGKFAVSAPCPSCGADVPGARPPYPSGTANA